MVNSIYDPGEVESERTVILSEREGSENEPLFRLGEAVQSACFPTSTLTATRSSASPADLRALTRDDLYDHYRSNYHPANAVLAVAGDFDTAAMLAAH